MQEQQLELKKRLLAECLKTQNSIVANARNAMNEAHESALEYDEAAEDNMVDSYREEMQGKRDMFARQLEHSLEDLALLHKVPTDKVLDSVMFGSVVITETQKLFVCISLGLLKTENDQFFAISPAAPLYKAISGLHKGDSFLFRDKKIKILDIF
jgi:transcription elongation GreA/GreB family factor